MALLNSSLCKTTLLPIFIIREWLRRSRNSRGNRYLTNSVSLSIREMDIHVHVRCDLVLLLTTMCFDHRYQIPRPLDSVPFDVLPVQHKMTFFVPARCHG